VTKRKREEVSGGTKTLRAAQPCEVYEILRDPLSVALVCRVEPVHIKKPS